MSQTPVRKLAVLLHADVVGSTSLVQMNETIAHERIQDTFRRFSETISNYGGAALEIRGDALVAEFAKASDSVSASLAFQAANITHNEQLSDEILPVLRIGIAMGEVVVADNTVTGEGIVLAQRLEQLAEPGSVCIQGAAYDTLPKRLPFEYENLGEQQVKGFDEPVRVYAVSLRPGGAMPESESPAQPEARALELPEKPSIAVLPFTNMSGDPEQEYFSDGIVDGITTALSRITAFFVIARTSAFIFKDQAVSFEKVRDTLGVRYFLEGGVQKAGNRVRINVQLIETSKGAHVWAEKYDGALSDIFELQDNIIEQVAGALHPNIRQAEIDRARRKRPQDLGAYDYVMRAMPFVWSLNQNDNQEATRLLAEAINLEPNYPLAISLMAWCYGQQAVYNWTTKLDETKEKTLSMAKRAESLSSDDPIVLAVLGAAHTIINDHESANVFLERSVSLDPNSAWAWSRLGWSKVYGEKLEDAIEHFQTALRLSPYDPMNFNCFIGIGCAYAIARDFENSIINFERGLHEHPGAIWAYRCLIPVYMEIGRIEDAQNGVRQLLQSYPELTATKVREAMVFQKAELDWIYKRLVKAGLPE